ncbi:cyclic lactone autoinducer peptide [Desnuesiella massiliensis]|nr:cyclic lactone autoinducer peptide [Desnuesiella massiliensis]
MSKKLLNLLASAAKSGADFASTNACIMLTYQPKMPDKLKKQK